MYYLQYLKNKELFEATLKEAYLKVRDNPLDIKLYKAEAKRVYEIGDHLFAEYNKLKRKFWLLGTKRKENKERVAELKSLLQILNYHARCLMLFRYNNEWRNNYDADTDEE